MLGEFDGPEADGPADLARQEGGSYSVQRERLAGLREAFTEAGVDWSSVPVIERFEHTAEAGADGARLGKGGGFADLEFALAREAGLISDDTLVVSTVHELQLRAAGEIPWAPHDAPVDLVVTPDRIVDCRAHRRERPSGGIVWESLTDEKIAAIPLLRKLSVSRGAQA